MKRIVFLLLCLLSVNLHCMQDDGKEEDFSAYENSQHGSAWEDNYKKAEKRTERGCLSSCFDCCAGCCVLMYVVLTGRYSEVIPR